jgi:hypothetical protein
MANENSFLGTGWAFPPTFEKATVGTDGNERGRVAMVSERQDIDQSLQILLSTSLGERVLQPEYGCNLGDFQFEPLNASLVGFLKDLVETAILYHEARIDVLKVDVTRDNSPEAIEGKLLISVEYQIRGTNSRFNFVYPFYQNEGVPNV